MSDLRKAAEMALEFVAWFASDDHSIRPKHKAPEIAEALRQALAQTEKPPVKTYCGGKPNYCTPHVDAVNMSQERVNKTEKREHEFFCPRCGHCCREWVGLTDEERHELNNFRGLMPLILAIEAKLKEKNT